MIHWTSVTEIFINGYYNVCSGRTKKLSNTESSGVSKCYCGGQTAKFKHLQFYKIVNFCCRHHNLNGGRKIHLFTNLTTATLVFLDIITETITQILPTACKF